MSEKKYGESESMTSLAHRLIVLSGPTAVGKGTIEKILLSKHSNIWISVSATTRSPRQGEVEGKDYHFMSTDEFNKAQAQGEFLETATVHHSAQYGTPLAPVIEHINANIPTLLEIDLQGARRVKQRAKELNLDVLSVFIAPPAFEDLSARLKNRGTESDEEMHKRLETAREELAAQDEFDVVIINDIAERAAEKLWHVIQQEYEL